MAIPRVQLQKGSQPLILHLQVALVEEDFKKAWDPKTVAQSHVRWRRSVRKLRWQTNTVLLILSLARTMGWFNHQTLGCSHQRCTVGWSSEAPIIEFADRTMISHIDCRENIFLGTIWCYTMISCGWFWWWIYGRNKRCILIDSLLWCYELIIDEKRHIFCWYTS